MSDPAGKGTNGEATCSTAEVAAAAAAAADPATLHRQNETALAEIEAATKEQPLTSERKPISSLQALYATETSASNFGQGLQALQQQGYAEIRTVRGDGNCFYRAFLYAVLEQMRRANNESEAKRITAFLKEQSWKDMLAAGYDEMALEVFYDAVVELLEHAAAVDTSQQHDSAALHAELNEENSTSDYCTW